MQKPLIHLFLSFLSLVVPFTVLAPYSDQTLQAALQQGPPRTNDRISGTVRSVDKNAKTITIQSRGVRTLRQVLCDGDTKLTKRDNQPGTLDALKKGESIVCTGSLNDKHQFLARVCTIQ